MALEAVAEQRAQVVDLDPDNAHYHYQLGRAYDSLMQAQRSSDPVRALVAGVQAMVEYREQSCGIQPPTTRMRPGAGLWTTRDDSRHG